MVIGRSAKKKGDLTQMKKIMSTMLALALVVGTATVTFAQADDKDKKTTTKKGGKKKGDAKAGDAKAGKDAPKKGKAKKAKDGDAAPATK
jgi:hypothetical protein